MSFLHRYRSLLLIPAVVGLVAVVPHEADAQARRGGGRGPRGGSSVVIIGGYRYAPYWFYDPWYQWGPYPYPYPPYGYGYGVRDGLTSSLRLEVTPREAQVFVDGYIAGEVDDFDGIFQRLRLRPGSHELAIYLDGYRTVVRRLYLNPGSDQKIRFVLERLRAGEVSEAPPPAVESPDEFDNAPPDDQRPGPVGPPNGPAPRRPGPGQRNPAPPREPADSFGTLSIRVQPADAEVIIDGERWSAPTGQDRIAIELSEGRHHVEVRKAGFSLYQEDVLIRRGSTLTLNVSLLRGGDR